MYLSDADIDLLVTWAKGKNPDKQFILNHNFYFNCVIFGADAPQRRYLQFIEFADYLETTYGDKLQNAKSIQNRTTLKKEFKGSTAETAGVKKETSTRVSNYWLKPVQSVAFAATKEASAPSHNGYLKHAMASVTGNDVKKFWERFGRSPHDLSHKVIPDAKAQGPNFVSPKAASVTKTGAIKGIEHYVYDFAVRRACKFLMYDANSNKRPVFYALDGLDLNKIVNLVTDTGEIRDDVKFGKIDDEKKVPVCTSELRESFRYWDSFSGGQIVFFKDFKIVPAPWLQNNVDLWGEYAVTRALKTRALAESRNMAGQLPPVDQIKGWTGKTAIDNYHEMKPSSFRGLVPLNSTVSGIETL